MLFRSVFVEGLAHRSYLLASEQTRQAIVIDPRRDVDVYLDAARQDNLTITHAIETHIHADFVSGSRELVEATGCECLVGPGSALGFTHREVRGGGHLKVGEMRLEFLHTPGHTPEHISILVEAEGQPSRVFTGDTLFVGAVGRPDLLGSTRARGLAESLYDSLFYRLLALDDEVEVHPAHGAGSLCGAGIGSEASSTIGAERQFNPWLKLTERAAFIEAVLGDLPETPAYFPRMKQINKEGPPLLGLTGEPPAAAPLDARSAARLLEEGAVGVDMRGAAAFADGHPAGALNIGFGDKLGYWAGWVIPGDARLVLIAASDRDVPDAVRQLLRVGLDRIEGMLSGGFEAWQAAGLPYSTIPLIPPGTLSERLASDDRLRVVDVRTAKEWREGHIEGAVHMPVGDVPARFTEVGDGPVATICEGGYRSSLAASLFARQGLRGVSNVPGGMGAYRQVGGG